MKIYSGILISLLIIQSNDCAQNELMNLSKVYYASYNGKLNTVFSPTVLIKKPFYRLSDKPFHSVMRKRLYHDLCNLLYTTQTPYIFINQKDVMYSLDKYGNYYSYNDEDSQCPIKFLKAIVFVEKPHCGDLAFCIRQSKDFEGKDTLVKLLCASYEVQKLVHPVDEYFTKSSHLVHLRNEIVPLVQKFYKQTFTHYTFQNYQASFREIFNNAKISYSIIIIKNAVLLFLTMDYNIPTFFKYIGEASFVLYTYDDRRSLNIFFANICTIFFLAMIEMRVIPTSMYYYLNLICTYWIAHASFFLWMLGHKYYILNKFLADYKEQNKVLIEKNTENYNFFFKSNIKTCLL